MLRGAVSVWISVCERPCANLSTWVWDVFISVLLLSRHHRHPIGRPEDRETARGRRLGSLLNQGSEGAGSVPAGGGLGPALQRAEETVRADGASAEEGPRRPACSLRRADREQRLEAVSGSVRAGGACAPRGGWGPPRWASSPQGRRTWKSPRCFPVCASQERAAAASVNFLSRNASFDFQAAHLFLGKKKKSPLAQRW